MTDINDFARMVPRDSGLCVVSTARADGTIQASLVNAGVVEHPVARGPVVALVANGGSRKTANLRARARATIVARAGWDWVAVEGAAALIGPDDPADSVDAERLRALYREVYTAAGGTHDDWDAFDRAMAEERRTCVFITPERVYSN